MMPASVGPVSRSLLLFRRRLWLPALLAAGVAVAAGAPAALADATVQVSGPGGSGCTLQDAVAFANNPSAGMTACKQPAVTGSAGTITIDVPAGDYVLTSTLTFSSVADVVIDGSGSGTAGTLFDGGGNVEPVHVASGQVTIAGVRVENGNSGSAVASGGVGGDPVDGNPGGGIYNAGNLTLSGDVVTANSTGAGGTVLCANNLSIRICSDGRSGGSGGNGGGIYNTGSLTVTNSTISDNQTGAGGRGDPGDPDSVDNDGGYGGDSGEGGGIYSLATLQISNSTIASNVTGAGGAGGAGGDGSSDIAAGIGGLGGSAGFGGGIAGIGPTSITASTLAGNATGAGGQGGAGGTGPDGDGNDMNGGSGGSGGGAYMFPTAGSPPVSVQDSTIEGNRTGAAGPAATGGSGTSNPGGGGQGAGIFVVTLASQPMEQDTIADNGTAGGGTGGGISGEAVFANSIVASNSPDNCSNGITAATANGSSTDIAFGDSSCAGFTVANPQLAALADNGGPTQTMALKPGSAALNLDPVSACPVGADQRGVARPQPGDGGCDAGAYEHAVPVISAVGATATLSSATVSAQINPDLSSAGTSVVVDYGTTGAYGSTVSGTTIARGAVAVPFSATLSGLAPGTTYHYRLVATNGDGQAVSGDATFTTAAVPPPPPPPPPPPVTPKLAVAIKSVSVSGAKAKLTLVCTGGAPGARCSGAVTLTAATSAKKGKAPKGKAVKRKAAKRKAVKPKAVKVASGRYALASGKSQTVAVSLNKVGRKLLLATYKLPVAVELGGAAASYHLKFAYPRITSLIIYTARFNGHGLDTISGIGVRGIPKGAAVSFACQTGRCSPRAKAFAVKKGASRLSLGNMVVKLRPKATVAFEVTHPGQVGHVLEISDDGPGAPKQSILCLPPGAKKPARCA